MEEEKDVNDYLLYYENINRSRGYIPSNRSQNSLKRPNFHFPSHKQPKQLRTSYLLDKRNQFNLGPLKGEQTPDTQEKKVPYESSTYDKPSDNSHGGYYWAPRNVSDNRWTADNVRTECTRSSDYDISKFNKNVESFQQNSIDNIHNTPMANDTYKNNTDNERSEQLFCGTEEKSVRNDSTDSKTNEIEKIHVDIGGKYGVDKKFGGKYKRGKLGNAGYNDHIIDKVYGSTEYRKNSEGSPTLYEKLSVNYNDDKVDVPTANDSYNDKIYGSMEYRKNIEGSPALHEKLSVNYNDDKVDVTTPSNSYNDKIYGSTGYRENIEGSAAALHEKLSVNYNDDIKVDVTTANNSYNDKIYGSTEYHKNIEDSPATHEKLYANYNDKVGITTANDSYIDEKYGSTEHDKNIEDRPVLYDKLSVNYNDDKVDVTTANNGYNDKMSGSTEYRQNIEDNQNKLNVEEEFHNNTGLKFGVDKKFGGKYKRKIVSSENKFDLNRPLCDTRSDIDKATHRFEDYKIGGEGSKSDHKQGFRNSDLGQQRSSNGSFSGEKSFDNYGGSTFMPKQNHISDGSLLGNQSMNSKTEGKNDRLADKEHIKQILINHANKSAQKGQIQSGNSIANINDIRVSYDRKPNHDQSSCRSCKTSLSKGVEVPGNVGKPTATTTTSASISNVISTSNEKIAKPPLVSSINNSVLNNPLTNNVKTIPAISNSNKSINPSTSAALIPGGSMNMNTTNVLPNVLGNTCAIRNSLLLANSVLNPLIKKIPPNPVINRPLQLMSGVTIPFNNSLLVGQNSMRAPSLIQHPVLSNIRIPFNQRSPLLPNQNVQLNNLTNLVFNRAQRFSLGRFR